MDRAYRYPLINDSHLQYSVGEKEHNFPESHWSKKETWGDVFHKRFNASKKGENRGRFVILETCGGINFIALPFFPKEKREIG